MNYRNLLPCVLFSLAAMSCHTETGDEKSARAVKTGDYIKKECKHAPRHPVGEMADSDNPDDVVTYFNVRCPDGKNYLAAAHQDGVIKATECEYQSLETSPCWDQIK